MKKIYALIVLCLMLSSCSPVSSNITATGGASVPAQPPNSQPTASATLPPSATPRPAASTPPPASASLKVPNFQHIILMVLENRDYADVINGPDMPFIKSLASQNVLLGNYFAVRHPSLPNYLALVSGSTQDVTKDCVDCFVDKPNLADLIETSGRTWKDYQEDMPSPCYVGNAPPYVQKHNPFLYFNSIRLNPGRCQRSVVPLSSLEADLAANSLPDFSFIMPNLCNSGHDCPAASADEWVKGMLTRLQASPALGTNSLIIVTFDEASDKDSSTCCGLGTRGGGHIATVLVSPLARPGFVDTTAYSHYSLLKTILTAWGLPDLANTALPGVEPVARPWKENAAVDAGAAAPGGRTGMTAAPPAAQTSFENCVESKPSTGNYRLNLCLSAPGAGTVLTGDVNVSAELTVTDLASGSTQGRRNPVQRVVFYLDGAYVLSDFQAPYTFTLPSAGWADGSHTLTVETQMRDTFVSPQAGGTFTFSNGGSTAAAPTGSQFQPTGGSLPGPGAPFIVAAAGDAAGGEMNAGRVSDLIASQNPNLLLYLGDVYERGSQAEFYNWYGGQDGPFGRFKSITDPTVGNHEYLTDNAAGYFNYWKGIPDYYSFDVSLPGGSPGGWHFISLNSNVSRLPTGTDSAEYKWLAQDLAAHAGACKVVFYHHPLFNIGPEGATSELEPLWKLLAQEGVSLVLNGHDHTYQRWQPLDGNGLPRPGGITEIIAGASGHGLQTIKNTDNRVAFSLDSSSQTFGALFLQLNPDGASFSFRATDGSIPDSGVIPCAGRGPDASAPSVPGSLAAGAAGANVVNLSWTAATDNTGVAGYIVFRDGLQIASLPASANSYEDAAAHPNTTYAYTLAAVDPAGNRSSLSPQVSVTMPDIASNHIFLPLADTYITAESPDLNYGSASVLRVDASPDVRSYLRFDVSGLGGRPVVRALLKFFARSSASRGVNIWSVGENGWEENAIDYNNAPALKSLISTTAASKAGAWITVDVSAYVTGEGLYSFGLGTSGTTSVSLASRESPENQPQLVIDLQ